MAEKKKDLKLDDVRAETRPALRSFAEKLEDRLGSNLQSITVVGSSLTADFKSGQSDINTIIVLGRQTPEALDALAGMAKSMSKKKLSAPVLMTPGYIERSSDVFGIEFLDFQLNHQTILGDDPFEKLSFSKKDVRLQCERELKATLIRLRQGYIAAAANPKLVRDILISAAKGLTPLARAMLWLKDIDRPLETDSTLRKAGSELSVDMEPVMEAGKWRRQKIRLSQEQMRTTFESVYETIDKLAVMIDKLEV